MSEKTIDHTAEVLIVGAGPVGLTLANLLGGYGVSVVLVEARTELIDYPRGVGMDDESFRTIQTMGLVDTVSQHTVPHHIMRLVNGRGQVLVTNDPATDEFGWPRKHGFVQPLVDRELLAGLDRFDAVTVRMGTELIDLTEQPDGVVARVRSGEAETEIRTRYVVGCEGGRSFTRSHLGAEFEGLSPSTRWVVVDIENDPLGTPNVYLGADPRRPYVSIGLPHGIRRFEFMLFDDEPTDLVDDEAFMASLLRPHLPNPHGLEVIGQRVFTHHGRIASTFRRGRILIAGDAAHLMPVWLGQGWNSGIRDATNLAWKLTSVLRGLCDDTLLDTYDAERRDHAKAMIDLNMIAGSVMTARGAKARVRDLAARAVTRVPSLRDWLTDMRFKPMPRYRRGVVVDQGDLLPGTCEDTVRNRFFAQVDAPNKVSPVGVQFIQPRVSTVTADDVLLDDVSGPWWSVVAWGNDPRRLFDDRELRVLDRLGVHLLAVFPESQFEWAQREYAGSSTTIVSDTRGRLKSWFDDRAVGVVFLRPDRFIAATCLAQQAPQTVTALLSAMSATDAVRTDTGRTRTGSTDVPVTIGGSR